MANELVIKGVRVHNLKNIDVTIPRDKLVVLTGLSGSGKSSLAFDTIYAEGHRRFVESLSSYARMFLGQLDKPDIDSIEGLSPAISIDQKTTSKNPRSTVGTVTEIYDYLRLLYARVGVPHCPICGKEIRQQTKDQIVERILALPEGTRFLVLAPVVRAQKGMHEKVFADARKSGYVRVRVDGSMYDLSEEIKLDKNKKHFLIDTGRVGSGLHIVVIGTSLVGIVGQVEHRHIGRDTGLDVFRGEELGLQHLAYRVLRQLILGDVAWTVHHVGIVEDGVVDGVPCQLGAVLSIVKSGAGSGFREEVALVLRRAGHHP